MNNKGQLQVITNPKTLVFTLGGAFLGFIIFNTVELAIIGGIAGLAVSFFR